MELSIGNYLTLKDRGGTVRLRAQNFFIGQNSSYENQTYNFMPFGFSGITINRNGDNTDASLVFPNNDISRNWSVEALRDRWLAIVYVMLLDPETRAVTTRMHQYYGQVAGGEWDETMLTLQLNTVLDAVGADFPVRRLNQRLIGALPVSNNVRLQ
jgi:hypothetical protein